MPPDYQHSESWNLEVRSTKDPSPAPAASPQLEYPVRHGVALISQHWPVLRAAVGPVVGDAHVRPAGVAASRACGSPSVGRNGRRRRRYTDPWTGRLARQGAGQCADGDRCGHRAGPRRAGERRAGARLRQRDLQRGAGQSVPARHPVSRVRGVTASRAVAGHRRLSGRRARQRAVRRHGQLGSPADRAPSPAST